jgi:hypothetical protein
MKGNQPMKHKLKSRLEKLEAITDTTAIVEVLPGETEGAAWNRHLSERPHDAKARIKVFLSYPPPETWTKPYHQQEEI